MTAPTCLSSHSLLGDVLGPALGFIGVALTLLWNGIQTRRQQAEIDRERQDSALRSLCSFRSALETQLDRLTENIQKETKWCKKHNSTLFTLLDYFEVYRNNLGRIGELSADELIAIPKIYYNYQDQVAQLVALLGHPGGPIIWGAALDIKFDGAITKADYVSGLKSLLDPADKAKIAISDALRKSGAIVVKVDERGVSEKRQFGAGDHLLDGGKQHGEE